MNKQQLIEYAESFWQKCQAYSVRFANFVASLSFWQFVGFCLLVLIAAGILEEFIPDSRSGANNTYEHVDNKSNSAKNDNQPQATKSDEHAASRQNSIVINKDSISIKSAKGDSAPTTPNEIGSTATNGTALPHSSSIGNVQMPKIAEFTPNPPPAQANQSAPEQFKIIIDEDEISITGTGDPSKYINLQKELRIGFEQLRQRAKRGKHDESNNYNFSLPSLAMLLIIVMLIIRLSAKAKLRAETKANNAQMAAESADLARQLAEAKLQTMQAQVEPHFLFNSLAAVEHLIETSPAKAAEMQRHLIAYLRSVLPNLREKDSTVGKELEIARNYLEVLKFRMEERLSFTLRCPEGLASAKMPPMMLPSLVENAIKHGLEPKAEGGEVQINVAIVNGKLLIEVSDSGMGFDPQQASSGMGFGLNNIRERLTAMFKDQASLQVSSNYPCGTKFSLLIPYSYA